MCAAVARKEKITVLHGLDDEAAHGGDAFLKYATLGELPVFDCGKPRLQLLPDSLVGPLVDVLIGRALEIEAADFRRAHAEQSEAALMVGVNQLFG